MGHTRKSTLRILALMFAAQLPVGCRLGVSHKCNTTADCLGGACVAGVCQSMHSDDSSAPEPPSDARGGDSPSDDQQDVPTDLGSAAAGAGLAMVPASYAFSTALVGSPGLVATFVVFNVGGTSTGDMNDGLGGPDSPDFVINSSSCTSVALAGGASCSITVFFTPASAGSKSAQLSVSASPGGTVAAPLSGTAQGSSLLIAPTSLVFPATAVGSRSASATFTVTNPGDTTVAVAPLIAGTDPTEFLITSSTCSGPLTPSASCSISVSLAPASAGSKSAQLFVNASPGGSAAAALSGDGT